MPYNGQLPNETGRKFYIDGILNDSVSFESDIWNFLVYLTIPFTNDTFLIDSRYKINHEIFKDNKIFFLSSSLYPVIEKSRIINIDTLEATEYSQIKIPDKQFYYYYEKRRTCPIGNHKDNLVEYLWGLPSQLGLRLAKKKKVILKGCLGSGDGGQLYYCKLHKIDF